MVIKPHNGVYMYVLRGHEVRDISFDLSFILTNYYYLYNYYRKPISFVIMIIITFFKGDLFSQDVIVALTPCVKLYPYKN